MTIFYCAICGDEDAEMPGCAGCGSALCSDCAEWCCDPNDEDCGDWFCYDCIQKWAASNGDL